MKYIDTDKLIAEIERQYRSIENATGDYAEGRRWELENLHKLIDSLQQEQPIQADTLTWKDINDLERIINNVHYEFRNGIGAKSFGEEVLERFREERDKQEQPGVDLEIEFGRWIDKLDDKYYVSVKDYSMQDMKDTARHFYELGLNASKED